MAQPHKKRILNWHPSMFQIALRARTIRPASLDDVEGTHHKRKLVRHPNTNDWYVLCREDMAKQA